MLWLYKYWMRICVKQIQCHASKILFSDFICIFGDSIIDDDRPPMFLLSHRSLGHKNWHSIIVYLYFVLCVTTTNGSSLASAVNCFVLIWNWRESHLFGIVDGYCISGIDHWLCRSSAHWILSSNNRRHPNINFTPASFCWHQKAQIDNLFRSSQASTMHEDCARQYATMQHKAIYRHGKWVQVQWISMANGLNRSAPFLETNRPFHIEWFFFFG